MKKSLFLTFMLMMTMPVVLFGQSYKKLWQQLEEAQEKDLPQQTMQLADKIADKARREKEYGHLLKAQLLRMETQFSVAPDSLKPEINRLEAECQRANDGALKAVYATVLSRLYDGYSGSRLDSAEQKSKAYAELALANPKLLAATKATNYEPFIIKGKDSRYFDNDLLSFIGRALSNYDAMHAQYVKSGNRAGACLSALWLLQEETKNYYYDYRESPYVHQLDSLIARYGDLDVSAELALERYSYMKNHSGAPKGELLDYIHQATDRWKKWPRMNQLRNAEQEMTNPQFQLRVNNRLFTSGTPIDLKFSDIRNLQELTLRVYKTDLTGNDDLDDGDFNDTEKFKTLQRRLTLMPELTQVRSFGDRAPYELLEDTLHLAGLPCGVYLLEVQTQPTTETSRLLLYVSDLFVMTEALPQNRTRIVVVNSTTGQPVPGARLTITPQRNTGTTLQLTCDSKGEAICVKENPRYVYACTDTDCGYKKTSPYGSFSYYGRDSEDENTNLFTDRSIYRPGQTVYAAALVHKTEHFIENSAVSGKQLTFRLRNANYKVVAEQQAVTDQYGKAAVQFILPTGGLNGRFFIETDEGNCYFRVEDYKRPTYEVTFDEVKQAYKAGDTVSVKGQARSYAGVGVQGAAVKYTVKRRVAFWWLSYSRYWQDGYYGYGRNDEEITSGETTTDAQGAFTVDVPLALSASERRSCMFYHYVVEADVTDQAGESREGSMSLPLGTRETVLTSNLPDKALKETLTDVTFHVYNAAGKDIEGKTVDYRLDGGEWQKATANTPITLHPSTLHPSPFTSGRHTLEAVCGTDTLKQQCVIFSLDDTVPCEETKDWFYVSAQQFDNEGTPVTVQVGSSDSDVHVVYTIVAGDDVIESGAFDQSNAIWNRKFTYQENYGNGLLLTFAWVKDGKLYRHAESIKRPLPKKKLTLRWDTFRDRLTPGQKEEWRLTVLNPDGTPADAQLMATLYDKSLDQINGHQWSFAPYIHIPVPSTSWRGSSWSSMSCSGNRSWTPLDVPDMVFNHFAGIGWLFRSDFESVYDDAVVLGYGTMRKNSVAGRVMMVNAEPMAMAEAKEEYLSEVVVATADGNAGETAEAETASVQMRENLNETAFFYPTLLTDKKGQVSIKFTLPESLTTWRFMGLATTKDMKFGMLEGEAVAQKEVMVQPNMPRFLRTGDQAQIAARIFNTSEKTVSGTSTLQLIDPRTNKTVLKQNQPFSVKAGETFVATFNVVPDGSCDLYICQVSAAGKTFSDGEQHYLAVLPNVERVTVTVPFTQHEPGTKAIDIARLFPAGTSRQKLTVEYTNNPVWLMVQALPSVGNPRDENAIDQAATLYSTIIARTLISQGADIKNVFEQWKREADNGSLTSNLSKNEELKDILLQETPWVVDADREDEQKQRLGEFFDDNTINNRINEAKQKLSGLQNGDGSWSWWPGMRGSFYMTVSISEMLARLNVMAGKQQETTAMLNKAFTFMGSEMVKEVAELKKREKEGHTVGFPSFKALQYLYICALDGRKLPKDVQAANDYLIGKMKKDIKNQTIYEKALSAIILNKIGEKKRSEEYAQSLKEYTVFTEEKGRYYDTPRAGYSWYDYKIPTEVMAIEALKVITPADQQTVEEMQRWLLQEKRTQAWDTPINSVNAVYAFLFDNTHLLDAQEQTVLAIDGKKLELPQSTAGVGYVKTAIDQPKGREFTAKKTSTGTSWGAVYAQFMQPVRDIENSGSGLTVKREIVVNGSPVNATGSPIALKVGDRIKVRITIDSERDLDFMQVLDRRAACMEPVKQLSGYRNGAYCSPKDYSTNYYFDLLRKGQRVIETEYFIDREGTYETGTCTVQCAYSPEYRATTKSVVLHVER
ncbi:MAG: alpha-2-macroglobulin [Prevotella sp.]|nr:alpha-2-macroglobulin [Prevotella sp.]